MHVCVCDIIFVAVEEVVMAGSTDNKVSQGAVHSERALDESGLYLCFVFLTSI